jgi:hypothetical protein
VPLKKEMTAPISANEHRHSAMADKGNNDGPRSSGGHAAKHWCFTLNNYTEDEYKSVCEVRPGWVDYICVGRESGESGTPHLQGYLCLQRKQRIGFLKTVLPRAHFESMKGTPIQASDYCKKDGDWVEFGTLPENQTAKARKEKEHNWELIKQQCYDDDLESIAPEVFIKHYSSLKKIRSDHRNKKMPAALDWHKKPPNMWFYGPTGVGKSHRYSLISASYCVSLISYACDRGTHTGLTN